MANGEIFIYRTNSTYEGQLAYYTSTGILRRIVGNDVSIPPQSMVDGEIYYQHKLTTGSTVRRLYWRKGVGVSGVQHYYYNGVYVGTTARANGEMWVDANYLYIAHSGGYARYS